MKRKTFLIRSFSTLAGIFAVPTINLLAQNPSQDQKNKPLIISTWPHGLEANVAAWEVLKENGRALDAVEKGVRVTELDPSVTSVGVGSYPDSDGNITLDASIMNEHGNCGAVSFLQHIKTPISVARMVMEKTPHVMLAGEGALQFALANGFRKEDLHTDFSRQQWKEWKKSNKIVPIDLHNHDTISMLAIDNNGDISGACTTGGLAFKHPGRVGDSPIIGAGLYVDNEIGGAGATGVGEVIMKTLGTHLIVELMRNGLSPYAACKEAVMRAVKKVPDARNLPVYYIAVNKQGDFGAYGTNTAFEYAVYTENKGNTLHKADSVF
ncbi:MAG: N(4)-(beta-N-acetylglucosaminyl)-L-asparaginase [Bacteroidales bacterium]|nr:N(4)-(beta-N-acetylglucosaminyl)-L-asparaginase [Bacteroidales bacterium]